MVRNQRSWSIEEDIELLGWIDFCKQQKVEPKEEILDFMVLFQDVPDRDFVKEKLTRLWQKYNDQIDETDQILSLTDMLTKGSAYMTKLPGEIHEAIRTRADQHISNDKSLLYTKVLKDREEEKNIKNSSEAAPLAIGDKRGVKRGTQQDKGSESLPLSKRARSSRDKLPLKATGKNAVSGLKKVRPPAEKPTDTGTANTGGATNCNSEELVRAEPQMPQSSPTAGRANEDHLKYLQLLEDKHSREIARIQELWQTEVETLSIKETDTGKTIRDLKAQVKHLTEAQKARQEGMNDPLESRVFEDLETIYRLTKENREMHRFATFTDLELPGTLHLGYDSIDDAMDQMQFELSSISYHRKSYQRPMLADFAISGDLRSLVRSAFGRDIGTAIGRKEVVTIMKKFDAQVCIRTLILAALRDWVFDSNFPNFAPSDSRLLSNYRDIVFGLDGTERLSCLDIAAHRSIIGGKGFKEGLIPRRATQLAARLSRAIAPLFDTSPHNLDDAVFHTWDEPLEVWKNRRAHLEEILQTALSLKAESVVTKCRYEFAIYAPGTTFTDDYPVGKNSGKVKDERSWIHASFHVYDAPFIQNTKEAALVVTGNFERKTVEQRSDAKYSKALLFPKRSTEGAPSRVIEVMDNQNPESTSTVQLSKDLATGTSRMTSGVQNEIRKAVSMSGSTGEITNPEEIESSPLPKCNECGKEFPASALLRRHEKNKSCAKCPDCGKRFGRVQALHKHQALEHTQYHQSDQKGSRHHQEVMAIVAKNFNPIRQNPEHNPGSQLLKVPRVGSTARTHTTSTGSRQGRSEYENTENLQADEKSECRRCKRLFYSKNFLNRHIETNVCSLDCQECHKSFSSVRERHRHQSDEHPKFWKVMETDYSGNTEKVSPQQEIEKSPEEDGGTSRCRNCGVNFARKGNLRHHQRTGVCDTECKQCNTKFDTVEERRMHQRITHHPRKRLEEALLIDSAIMEPETPRASPTNPGTQSCSTPTRIPPSSSSAQSLDTNGKRCYKKASRREVDDSDADEILSPSELVKTKRAQRRTSTRSSDRRGEVGIIDSQEALVRPRGKRDKTPAIDE
ncbi:hypothetical protein BTUL_0025g00450 [Botrytis tulipae]|uniref:C2H2-type domain-containing protein n=1 Tax=Botrytis tulipae TaxID=87230 RepID=A0A4Z1EYT8_9HELO|nr:hypothetical protein BTUL_0025g00450 [Botrytis tulipae]